MKQVNIALVIISAICTMTLSGWAAEETTFELYPDAVSTEQLTTIELDNTGHTIAENILYYAGNVYLKVTPGTSPGNWNLIVYTSNRRDVRGVDEAPLFNVDDASDLFIQETDESGFPLERSLTWKYFNERLRGYEFPYSVGDTIGNGTKPETSYYYFTLSRWFVNVDDDENVPADMTTGDFDYSIIVNHDHSWDFSNRIQLAFIVNLSKDMRLGTYGTTLNFEIVVK